MVLMSTNSDVLSVSSDGEDEGKASANKVTVVRNPVGEANVNSDNDTDSVSVVSIGDDDSEDSNLSDCEIVSVEDVGEEKWRNFQSPIKMLNSLLQAGYSDPSQLLQRIFGMSPDSMPEDLSQQWGLLLTLLTEPSPRPRIRHINTIEKVLELLDTCSSILVVTGAGISVSCGIPDFRSKDGIYARLAEDYPDLSSPQAMFDMKYFLRNPSPFYKFAKEIFPGQFSPSLTHRFVALLEQKGKLLRNYTQNIDTLEQAAGITQMIQCHGSFITATCVTCKHRVPGNDIKEAVFSQKIPYCPKCRPSTDDSSSLNGGTTEQSAESIVPSDACYGVMKPDIVFFGEDLSPEFHDALASDVKNTDLVVVIGSSLKVRPVAHIPNSIPENIPQILINRESLSTHDFDVELLGDCDVIVQELCRRLGWQVGAEGNHQELMTMLSINELIEDRAKTTNDANKTEPSQTKAHRPTDAPDATDDSATADATPKPVADSECTNDVLNSDGANNDSKDIVHVLDSEDECTPEDLIDVAAILPEKTYVHIPPNQYVFPGAELLISKQGLVNSSEYESDSESDAHSSHAQLDADTMSMTVAVGPTTTKELTGHPKKDERKALQALLSPTSESVQVNNNHTSSNSRTDKDAPEVSDGSIGSPVPKRARNDDEPLHSQSG